MGWNQDRRKHETDAQDSKPERRVLPVQRIEQPDAVTCGPTCVKSVYEFYGDHCPLEEIVASTRRMPDGGTLAVYLGLTAVCRRYKVTLYPLGIQVFDPTWWKLSNGPLKEKLNLRAAACEDPEELSQILAWKEFLELKGRIEFTELRPKLLVRILDRGHPLICGLSATWLYRHARERPEDNLRDDIRGQPVGHFVVVCGYSGGGRHFHVSDPAPNVPFNRTGKYVVAAERLLAAILLGDVTSDAVLLELWPDRRPWKVSRDSNITSDAEQPPSHRPAGSP